MSIGLYHDHFLHGDSGVDGDFVGGDDDVEGVFDNVVGAEGRGQEEKEKDGQEAAEHGASMRCGADGGKGLRKNGIFDF